MESVRCNTCFNTATLFFSESYPQCVAVCCSVLQCAAVCCSVVDRHSTLNSTCTIQACVAQTLFTRCNTHDKTLQHTLLHTPQNTLQHRGNKYIAHVLQLAHMLQLAHSKSCTTIRFLRAECTECRNRACLLVDAEKRCTVLQGVAVCCSVLQCAAVCSSVLQCATSVSSTSLFKKPTV